MEYIILETKVLNTQNLSLPNYFITFTIFDASEVIDDFCIWMVKILYSGVPWSLSSRFCIQ